MNETPQPSKRRAWVWPAIIIGMLGSHVMMCITVMVIANSDPAFAVVDDYHDKALAWDEHMAEVRASDALGWTAALSVGDERDVLNRRSITLVLTDVTGRPIDNASVVAEAFAHSRSAERIEFTLHPAAPGRFVGPAPLQRRGLWEFRITATRGNERYVTTQQLLLN